MHSCCIYRWETTECDYWSILRSLIASLKENFNITCWKIKIFFYSSSVIRHFINFKQRESLRRFLNFVAGRCFRVLLKTTRRLPPSPHATCSDAKKHILYFSSNLINMHISHIWVQCEPYCHGEQNTCSWWQLWKLGCAGIFTWSIKEILSFVWRFGNRGEKKTNKKYRYAKKYF